ncbi:hypothetical protein ACROYT_G041130 [Oculina patagonica]
MVYSSAYRRAYRKPLWDDFSKEEFISKLQYRSDRRSVEHRHEPWRWESDSEEDEDIEEIPGDDGSYDGGRREFIPREEKIDKRAPKQAWEERKEIKENGYAADKALVLPEKLKYGEDVEEKSKHSHVVGNARAKERDRGERKHHRRSEEKRKQRSKSTSPEKNHQSFDERRKKAPFLPYGRANEGPVDMWKTHNVLAAQPEVYPAALRAQKRRQQEIKKKAQLREEAVKKKETPAHFDVDVAFPKTWWMTEYQRNFCREEDVKRHFLR